MTGHALPGVIRPGRFFSDTELAAARAALGAALATSAPLASCVHAVLDAINRPTEQYLLVKYYRPDDDYDHAPEHWVKAVPRVGDYVGLLPSPVMSAGQTFRVKAVSWPVDHTKFDACGIGGHSYEAGLHGDGQVSGLWGRLGRPRRKGVQQMRLSVAEQRARTIQRSPLINERHIGFFNDLGGIWVRYWCSCGFGPVGRNGFDNILQAMSAHDLHVRSVPGLRIVAWIR